MGCSPVLFFGLQRVGEERDDLCFRPRTLEQQFEDSDGRRIQQVGVPRQGIEDDSFVIEVPDQEAFDGCKSCWWGEFRLRVGHDAVTEVPNDIT